MNSSLPVPSKITQWLSRAPQFQFALYVSISAFCLYASIFSLRKTFGVATFQGLTFGGLDFKSWMVIIQVVGYLASKFIGIKVISELNPASRARGILYSCTAATLLWLLFAVTPVPYNLVFLFFNGLSLGLVWGMVFGYLEGRKLTEVLGASLCVSFIFSAGFAKTIGGLLMRNFNVPEMWMPFAVSCLFFPPLLIFLWLLDKIPAPSAEDEALRTKRSPMTGQERVKFTRTFLPGLALLVLSYMLLTSFREFRDNFSAEIWQQLGFGNQPGIFTFTESIVSVTVLVSIGSLILLKNNFRAMIINHIMVIIGMALVGLSTFAYEKQLLSAPAWMTLVGMGLYFGYIQFNSIFFDRLIATFKYVSTVGFLIYVADSFGYLGSVAVVLYKNFGQKDLSWVSFFVSSSYILSIAGIILMVLSLVYFRRKFANIQ